jgi:hypothetical protein
MSAFGGLGTPYTDERGGENPMNRLGPATCSTTSDKHQKSPERTSLSERRGIESRTEGVGRHRNGRAIQKIETANSVAYDHEATH